ncbi:hypothetical protein FOL47_005409 [Perkinsus chesapeaki]|uniref:Uncharacterized protein n=1 Tax=Perkinsus chesapeaki TaxID=330153 RepID=A0A7J6N3W1_PERCH|nr:hypothetical protein FOL47_005409 [Perkinsus chesapeaki]
MNEFYDFDEDCDEDINTIDFALTTVIFDKPFRLTRAARSRGEAPSVEPARKRRAELMSSLAKRRKVDTPSARRSPASCRQSSIVGSIKQQLAIIEMNLDKNNELLELHDQRVDRYLKEALRLEQQLRAVERDIEDLLEKRRVGGEIKDYQIDFARFVYMGNHNSYAADLRRDGVIVNNKEDTSGSSQRRGG